MQIFRRNIKCPCLVSSLSLFLSYSFRIRKSLGLSFICTRISSMSYRGALTFYIKGSKVDNYFVKVIVLEVLKGNI